MQFILWKISQSQIDEKKLWEVALEREPQKSNKLKQSNQIYLFVYLKFKPKLIKSFCFIMSGYFYLVKTFRKE